MGSSNGHLLPDATQDRSPPTPGHAMTTPRVLITLTEPRFKLMDLIPFFSPSMELEFRPPNPGHLLPDATQDRSPPTPGHVMTTPRVLIISMVPRFRLMVLIPFSSPLMELESRPPNPGHPLLDATQDRPPIKCFDPITSNPISCDWNDIDETNSGDLPKKGGLSGLTPTKSVPGGPTIDLFAKDKPKEEDTEPKEPKVEEPKK